MTNELEGQISLTEYLNDIEVDSAAEVAVRETILEGDDAQASSLLRRLGAIEKQINANSAMAERERGKITAWEISVNETLQNSALWLRSLLEGFAMHERQEFDRKTINLPFGVLKTAPANAKWEIDEDLFLPWAKAQNIADLYRVKETPALTAIKGTFTVDSSGTVVDQMGIPVPGVKVIPPERPFTVTVKPSL